MNHLNDRELQDEIIRYLTEPAARAKSGATLALLPEQAARAAHFARFLARRYYRDRLGRSFRYSAMLVNGNGHRAMDVVETNEFNRIASSEPMGSLAAAQQVGALAIRHLARAKDEAWWPALLEYERAHFLQTATSESTQAGRHLGRGASAVCRQFDWHLPELLQRIKAKQPMDDAGNLHRPVTLLFSRTHAGKIFVMEVDAATAAVFSAVDGARSVVEISERTAMPLLAVEESLQSLKEVGAVA